MKKILIFVYILFSGFILISCTKRGNYIESYEKYKDLTYATESFMPDINDLETYKRIEVRYKHQKDGKKTLVLAVEYSEEAYEIAVNLMEHEIAFLQDPV